MAFASAIVETANNGAPQPSKVSFATGWPVIASISAKIATCNGWLGSK